MTTLRQKCLKGEISYDKYMDIFAQKVMDEIGVIPPKEWIPRIKAALNNGDEHLNSIPLKKWDSWFMSLMTYNGDKLRKIYEEAGDQISISGGVSLLKHISKIYVSNKGGNDGKN